jgi:hypothetical protein
VVEVSAAEPGATKIVLEIIKGADPRENIFRYCVEQELILLEMIRERVSLESVFRQLTSKEDL